MTGTKRPLVSMDRALAQFVDDLNSGLQPKVIDYVARCPKEQREEIKDLIEFTLFFRENHIPKNIIERELILAHQFVNDLAEKQKVFKEKTSVNFRKGDLTDSDKKIIQDELDRAWEEAFGEDKK